MIKLEFQIFHQAPLIFNLICTIVIEGGRVQEFMFTFNKLTIIIELKSSIGVDIIKDINNPELSKY